MGRIFEVRKHTMFARWNRMAKQFAKIGKDITIVFAEGTMRQRMHYTALNEPTFLSYTWIPGQCVDEDVDPSKATTVEMHLVELDNKTSLLVKEYGFAKLGQSGIEPFKMNTEGWSKEVLPGLKTFVEEHERAKA